MTRPAKPLLISYILFGVAIVLFIASAIIGAVQAKPALEAFQEAQQSEQVQSPIVQPTAQEAVENTPSEPSSRTSSPATVKDQAAAPRTATGEEAPQKQQGAHIPFTNDPVTPGDPESYKDTVGQCPFYEMGDRKSVV